MAELLEAAHDKAGNRTYHSELGLSYAVQLAYYAAQGLKKTKGRFLRLIERQKKPSLDSLLL
ncbi:MAG: hypothetical protein IJT37_06565 [Lachnospiraceae bacterium]|nr:hypothetical protein [Lachnospiraceae bacterium]